MAQMFALENRNDRTKYYCTFTGEWVHVFCRTIFDKAGRDTVPADVQAQGEWKELKSKPNNYRHRLIKGELLPRVKPYFFLRWANDIEGLDFKGPCRFAAMNLAQNRWADEVRKMQHTGAGDHEARAYLHCADHKDEITADADFELYVGPNGGLRCLKLT